MDVKNLFMIHLKVSFLFSLWESKFDVEYLISGGIMSVHFLCRCHNSHMDYNGESETFTPAEFLSKTLIG